MAVFPRVWFEDLSIIQMFGFAFPQFHLKGIRLKKESLWHYSLEDRSSVRLGSRSRSWPNIRFLSICFYLQDHRKEVSDTIHKEKLRFVVGTMTSSLSVIPHVIIISAEFITGITVNGFLIIINCNELIKSRKLTPMPLVLICIGMSRFGLQMVLMIQSYFSVFFPFHYQVKIYGAMMMFAWMFFNSLSLWFATCLSVFYCLKILGFTQSYFLWLKFRISKLMPWLLLGSLLASLITAALCIEVDYHKYLDDDILRNVTLTKTGFKLKRISDVFLVNLALIFPLAIFVMCTSMLLISVCKHTHRMQNGYGFRNASMKVHLNTLKTLVTFFFFFVSYFVTFMTSMTFTFPYRSQRFFLVKDIMSAYPSGHSVIIILSNSKLQQPFRRLLCTKKESMKRRTNVK